VTEIAHREDLPTRPFCSTRCQQIDLGRWLNEEYVVSDPLNSAKDHLPSDADEAEDSP